MPSDILLIGYGNPSRLDDGLGPACASAIEALALPGVRVDSAYQLGIEDAADVDKYDAVLFADADASGPAPFDFRAVTPVIDFTYTSHALSPETVMGIATRMFGARTRAYVLAIRGYAFDDFGETLSAQARTNLDAAVRFIADRLAARDFDAALARLGKPAAQPAVAFELANADMN